MEALATLRKRESVKTVSPIKEWGQVRKSSSHPLTQGARQRPKETRLSDGDIHPKRQVMTLKLLPYSNRPKAAPLQLLPAMLLSPQSTRVVILLNYSDVVNSSHSRYWGSKPSCSSHNVVGQLVYNYSRTSSRNAGNLPWFNSCPVLQSIILVFRDNLVQLPRE